MSDVKRYAERDIMALDEAGGFYYRHIDAMTGESLHSKSDIAAELGYRDMQIKALQAENDRLNNSVALLRGQLQNTVNHLDSCRRGYHSLERKILPCIESANKSLYESLHGLGQYANKLEGN